MTGRGWKRSSSRRREEATQLLQLGERGEVGQLAAELVVVQVAHETLVGMVVAPSNHSRIVSTLVTLLQVATVR